MAIVVDIKANTTGLAGPMQSAGMTAKRAAGRIDVLAGSLSGLTSSVNAAIRRVDALARRFNSLHPGSGPGSSPSGGGGGGRGGKPKAPPVQSSAYDWAQYWNKMNRASGGKYKQQLGGTLHDAIQQLHASASGGNAGALRKLWTLQAMQAKMNGGGIGQKIQNLVYSTRFGVGGGGGVQPLIGRTLQVLSSIHPAAGAAAAGLAAAGAAAMAAAQRLHGLAMGQAVGGGSAGQAAAINQVARYFGMSGSELAKELQSGFEGGYGASAAARYGINPVGGPYGDNNYNAKAIKFLRGIGNESSFEQARRVAESVGMPELADFQKMSKSDREGLLKELEVSESSVNAARKLHITLSRLESTMDRLASKAEPFIWVLDQQVRIIERSLSLWSNVATSPFKGYAAAIDALKGGGRNSAADKNVKALDENTRQLKEFRQVFGGGERSNKAIPQGMKHPSQFNDAAVRGSVGTSLF